MAIVCYLSFAWIIKIALILLALIYGGLAFHQQLQWQAIKHDENGWWLKHAGQEWNVEMSGDSTITGYVLVLRFNIPGKRWKKSCVIFRDAVVSHDIYRQLIVRLRNYKSAP